MVFFLKFNKFFILLVVLLAGFLVVNASVATELDDSVISDSASSNQDISINDVDNNVKASDAGSDINKLGDGEKNFAYLNDLIQNTPEGGEVTLDANIEFNSSSDIAFKNGIVVDKSITINGDGYIIFCFNSTRVFNVTADDVTIKNLNIFDGNATEGGAIYWSGNDGTMSAVTFNSCIADYAAGAIIGKVIMVL